REAVGREVDVRVESEITDSSEPGVSHDRSFRYAELYAEAIANVLAIGRAPSRAGLGQQSGSGGGLDFEVQIGSADEFNIQAQDVFLEVSRQVIDPKPAVGVGGCSPERIILQPVHIDRADLDTANRGSRAADHHAATDDPGVKPGSHQAPISRREA